MCADTLIQQVAREINQTDGTPAEIEPHLLALAEAVRETAEDRCVVAAHTYNPGKADGVTLAVRLGCDFAKEEIHNIDLAQLKPRWEGAGE